jgi:hypothetical protein
MTKAVRATKPTAIRSDKNKLDFCRCRIGRLFESYYTNDYMYKVNFGIERMGNHLTDEKN